MTDRELLEAAAKAVGYEVTWDERLAEFTEKTWFSYTWNPLTSDEDAFRLMVDCGMTDPLSKSSERLDFLLFSVDHNNDKHAATRRAIVRAAAGE